MSDWLPVTEFAEDWKADEWDQFPPPRAAAIRSKSGRDGIHVQVATHPVGRDPVEGERMFRVPPELRKGERLVHRVEILDQGKFRIEEQILDEEGWFLVPRVLFERPVTPEDHANLEKVSP